MKNSLTKKITRAGIVGALYALLTVLLAPISYGPFQLRIAESLSVLPLVFPETAIGLTVGCFISNVFGNGPLDMILGTLATAISAVLTAIVGKKTNKTVPKLVLGELPPVIINAFIIPVTFLAASDILISYFYGVLTVAIGQAITCAFAGTFVYFLALKIKENTLS